MVRLRTEVIPVVTWLLVQKIKFREKVKSRMDRVLSDYLCTTLFRYVE